MTWAEQRQKVPVAPLEHEVRRRAALHRGDPKDVRLVLMPGATGDEWQRSNLCRNWHRWLATREITYRSLDEVCVRVLHIHPSELGYE